MCSVEKELCNYYKNNNTKGGFENTCKKCRNKHTLKTRNKENHNKNAKTYRVKNKEKLRINSLNSYYKEPEKRKNSFYVARYGITLENAKTLLKQQFEKCSICYVPISVEVNALNVAHVDHCHTTGKVRGLLCSSCNTGLGLFKDSSNNLIRAIEYLKKHE